MPASEWIREMLTRFAPPTGHAIDLACGSGRHTELLCAHGLSVLAVDRNADRAVLGTRSGVTFQCMDLEADAWPLEGVTADVVVVSNYLYRPQLSAIFELVGDGGLLIYETFGEGNAAFGKPSRPDFLLREGELVKAAPSGFRLLDEYFGEVTEPKPAVRARACFLRERVGR